MRAPTLSLGSSFYILPLGILTYYTEYFQLDDLREEGSRTSSYSIESLLPGLWRRRSRMRTRQETLPSNRIITRQETLPSSIMMTRQETLPSSRIITRQETLPSSIMMTRQETLPSSTSMRAGEVAQQSLPASREGVPLTAKLGKDKSLSRVLVSCLVL